MAGAGSALLLACVTLVAWSVANFDGVRGEELQTKTFRSPSFTLGPGGVIDRYLKVEMPKGHIAVRSLDMNVVSSDGTAIPLSETYLHHWVLLKYHLDPKSTDVVNFMTVPVPNDGVCNPLLVQFFGLGSEFRKTNTTVPPPYGIVLGNPADVPEGKEEQWYLNVHAIDTRDVLDRKGCYECLCDVYNVTVDGYGRPLPAGYVGGIFCCHDGTHCPLQGASKGTERELFLEFVVKYVDFSPAVVPVKVYLLDVTDQRKKWNEPAACMVEYTVPKCADGTSDSECEHTQEAVAFLPRGGYVVASSAHMHSGGKVASVSLENGEDICVSHPIYGEGDEAGNEKGYIVGMKSCYPDPKSIYIRANEKLSLRTVYDNKEIHTGVMGLLLLLIEEAPAPWATNLKMVLATLTIGVAVLFVGVSMYQNRSKRRSGGKYKPIV